jgi:hypothetical protein
MYQAHFELTGLGELLQGGYVTERKKSDETHEVHAERTKQLRVHCDEKGVYIPAAAFRYCMESAGKWLAEKLEGKKTFTKRLQSGLDIVDNMYLVGKGSKPIKRASDCEYRGIPVPGTGKRQQGSRVERWFGVFSPWATSGTVYVLDDMITPEVLRRHLDTAGLFVGFGAMRAENCGGNGRFRVESLTTEDLNV